MPLVLDASIALAWCFEDETTAETDGILNRLEGDFAMVPAIWSLEVANALLTAERHQRLQVADTARFIGLLRELPISIVDTRLDQTLGPVLDLARSNGLTSYDACYLELAMREGVHLATQDGGLRRAAQQLGVPVLPEFPE